MQAQGNRAVQKRQSLDMIDIRRNPYLLDYEEQKRLRKAANEGSGRSGSAVGGRSRRPPEAENIRSRRPVNVRNGRSERPAEVRDGKHRKQSGTADGASRRSVEVIDVKNRRSAGMRNERNRKSSGAGSERPQRSLDLIEIGREQRRAGAGGRTVRTDRQMGRQSAKTRRQSAKPDWRAAGASIRRQPRTVSAGRQRSAAAAKKRRRKQVLQRKIMAAAWVLCIFMIGWLILLKKGNASELNQNNGSQEMQTAGEESGDTSSVIVQGISSERFVKHPSWTEDFLPVNEFSRPGETLSEVRDIFVHYTANPGTSAAQNRSYFEQQKDMHEASVSAHFIIGYEGEIIQCVPLDEIAYAVQTRNYDSISIECCYKASDGSFTQETYDSLISLLTWLTETYNLDTGHILRHYDCGGKKCPLYYTEHEDAWAQLKADVAAGQAE